MYSTGLVADGKDPPSILGRSAVFKKGEDTIHQNAHSSGELISYDSQGLWDFLIPGALTSSDQYRA